MNFEHVHCNYPHRASLTLGNPSLSMCGEYSALPWPAAALVPPAVLVPSAPAVTAQATGGALSHASEFSRIRVWLCVCIHTAGALNLT